MTLVSNLDINNNLLKNGSKNIGPIESDFEPVNKDQISLRDVQNALLDSDGNIPAGLTFEEFIRALMTKVNEEVKTLGIIKPKIIVRGKIEGTGKDVSSVIEVGSASSSYTLKNSVELVQYIDGQALTHEITMGRSQESESYLNVKCDQDSVTYIGGLPEGSSSYSSTVNFTVFGAGKQGSEESKTMTVNNITMVQNYLKSSYDIDKNPDGTWKFSSSWGNPLYSYVGQAIPAGSCSASTTTATSKTISTKFYCWAKSLPYLGGVSLTNQTLNAGDIFVIPTTKTLKITWTTVTEDDSKPSAEMLTASNKKYLRLPSEGVLADKLVDTIPTDVPYMEYKVYTITSKIPKEIKNAKITIS